MELPIYQENLKSSGDWRADLVFVYEKWQQLKTDAAQLEKLRQRQIDWLCQDAAPACILTAIHTITAWAQEPNTLLSLTRLLELNRTLTEQTEPLRQTEIVSLNPAHEPPLAILLPRLLENAMGWFETEGFAEMNPVEQAALVHLRLLDLSPFAAANHATATLAASFYLERAGLPPLLFAATDPKYQAVLHSAFRMLTQHLVEYFAEQLHRAV